MAAHNQPLANQSVVSPTWNALAWHYKKVPQLISASDSPLPVLTASLYERFSSRDEADFENKLLSAIRYKFGGHLEKPAGISEAA
jgi:hypothetical protein